MNRPALKSQTRQAAGPNTHTHEFNRHGTSGTVFPASVFHIQGVPGEKVQSFDDLIAINENSFRRNREAA
jgi:hypothetical protein